MISIDFSNNVMAINIFFLVGVTEYEYLFDSTMYKVSPIVNVHTVWRREAFQFEKMFW